MQPTTGYQHFSTSITTLKQVTGRTQHDLQHYIIAVIAGAVLSGIVHTICALLDFRYLSQAPSINENERLEVFIEGMAEMFLNIGKFPSSN
ncbi:hypothetical protein HYDPIDRAFT_25735 [Hydnomerulius pinastri MD-312]|nr:hypothetical protein HYDPIDRAFT_25735 [Hydnomerulius pinastri MD-312]